MSCVLNGRKITVAQAILLKRIAAGGARYLCAGGNDHRKPLPSLRSLRLRGLVISGPAVEVTAHGTAIIEPKLTPAGLELARSYGFPVAADREDS